VSLQFTITTSTSPPPNYNANQGSKMEKEVLLWTYPLPYLNCWQTGRSQPIFPPQFPFHWGGGEDTRFQWPRPECPSMASTLSRLKFGGLGVYCYRATYVLLLCVTTLCIAIPAYSILYLGSWNAHPGFLCWDQQLHTLPHTDITARDIQKQLLQTRHVVIM